jgi:membrane protease YdiL (CAAX protease family)
MLDAIVVVGLVIFFLTRHGESPAGILFGRRRAVAEVVLGIVLMPAVFLLVGLVLLLILTYAPELHNVPRNPLEDMLQNRKDALIFAIVVMIAGGVREEVQRGFILHRFDRYLGGAVPGLIIFSILFGLGHIDQGYDAALATGVLGAAWGGLYLARRSIIAPMVSHAGFNLAQLVNYVALR